MQEVFYVGTSDKLATGDVKTGPFNNTGGWKDTVLNTLDSYRPAGMLAYKDAVHLVEDHRCVCFYSTNWVSAVHSLSPTSRHDKNWLPRLAQLLHAGGAEDSPEVVAAANGYWNGNAAPAAKPHLGVEPTWEILTSKALIIRSEPVDVFKPNEADRQGLTPQEPAPVTLERKRLRR